jgi:hypothetical protein
VVPSDGRLGRGRDGVRRVAEAAEGDPCRTPCRGERAAVSADRLTAGRRLGCAALTTPSRFESITPEAAAAPRGPPPVLTQSTPAASAATARTAGAARRTAPDALRVPAACMYSGNVLADAFGNRSCEGTLTRGNAEFGEIFLHKPAQT